MMTALTPKIDFQIKEQGTIALLFFEIEEKYRGLGLGEKAYLEFEASLPNNIKIIELMAADTGSGHSAGFWEKMGFDWKYKNTENLGIECFNMMRKGINGNPTPKPE